MAGKNNNGNMLLLNVPVDVKEIIERYKNKKMEDCGCRFGNSQAVFNMLRKLNAILKGATPTQTSL